MKKSILYVLLLISILGYSQVKAPARFIKDLPKANLDTSTQNDINSGGAGNANITIANTPAEITAAGTNAKVEIQNEVDLTSDFTLPAGTTLIFTTGFIDDNGWDFDWNGGAVKFNGKAKGFDMRNGTMTGNVTLLNDKIYASNLGAVDDGLESTDNHQLGLNFMHIANQNGYGVFNKQSTGIYYTSVYDTNVFVAGQSPFYPNDFTQNWKIGNGYNGVTIELEGGVEIRSIRNDLKTSCIFKFYNTRNSTLKGGTLRGDRYVHRYNREIDVDVAVTSANNVTLTIREPDLHNPVIILNTIVETIPVTVGTIDNTATEIANYINTNLGGQGYVATASGGNVTFYKEGLDFSFDIDAGSTGATFTETESPYEWGHGIYMDSYSLFCTVSDLKSTEFHGDGLTGAQQGNGTTAITQADLTQGFIDENGVVDNGNTGYYYLTTPRDLPSPHEWFSFAPNAQASNDLLHNKYWIIYLDENDNFLEKSKTLIPYERYNPRQYKDGRPEVAKYQILVENNGTNISNFNYFVNSRSYTIANTFRNLELSWNRRHASANPGTDVTFENCLIHDNSGQEPRGGINFEDDHKHPNGWRIIGCEFWNNANFDIILKGATNGLIQGNIFHQDSWNVRLGWDDKGLAIDTGYGRNITITQNQFRHKRVHIDIGTIFSNNQLFYSRVHARAGGSIISNNLLENSTINDGTSINEFNSQSAGGNTKNFAFNNVHKITDGWGNRRFIDQAGSIEWRNNLYFFNDKSTNQSTLNDPSLREVRINSTSSNYMRADRVTVDDGVHDANDVGTEVYDLKTADALRHQVGWTVYASDFKDFYIDGNLIIDNGFEKSFKITNGTINGWVNLILNEFPDDGTGTFKTIIIRNVDINVPEEIDATNGVLNNTAFGSTQWTNLFKTAENKNVNLIFDGVTFNCEDSATNRFFYFGHRGTTLLKDCYFLAKNANSIDFTQRGSEGTSGVYRSATNGIITVDNPTYLDGNVSITLEGTDILK